MEVVYVDNHLCVVNKPAGMPTQASPEHARNVVDEAKQRIKEKFNKPGAVFLEPIHRLDRPVAGLVLLARTSKALSRLQAMMRERKIKKWYYGWVAPIPNQKQARLEHALIHAEHRAQVVRADDPRAKLAILEYQILRVHEGKALLEIQLHTGRYHQIRAQFSAIGCPILGDRKYHSQHAWKGEGIALYHGKLELVHPVTGAPLEFTDNAWSRS